MSGQHTPGMLSVVPTGINLQYRIVSDTSGVKAFEEWDDVYVEFAGYFGSYGPHIFAAAPDLLEALENLVGSLEPLVATLADGNVITSETPEVTSARAAIAKATGAA